MYARNYILQLKIDSIYIFQFSWTPAAVDYTSITDELLTFSPSVTRQNVSITLNDDGINENIENFLASLAFQGDVRNTIRLLPDQATIQIMDDDGKLDSITTFSFHYELFITTIFAFVATNSSQDSGMKY